MSYSFKELVLFWSIWHSIRLSFDLAFNLAQIVLRQRDVGIMEVGYFQTKGHAVCLLYFAGQVS